MRKLKVHNDSAPNMEVLRMFYVEACLRAKSKVTNSMVRDRFRCSATAASSAITHYRALNPGVTEYVDKEVMARNNFQPTITAELSTDAVFQFINVMADAAPAVRAALKG